MKVGIITLQNGIQQAKKSNFKDILPYFKNSEICWHWKTGQMPHLQNSTVFMILIEFINLQMTWQILKSGQSFFELSEYWISIALINWIKEGIL